MDVFAHEDWLHADFPPIETDACLEQLQLINRM